MLNCLIDLVKYNFHKYNIPSPIFAYSLSPSTTIKELFTYNQALPDPRWIEEMHKELEALETNQKWEVENNWLKANLQK